MSTAKTSAHRHQHSRHGEQRSKPATQPMSSRAVYLGALIVGFFIVMLGWLLSEGSFWRQVALGYLALLILNINFSGWDIVRGKHIAGWKQALAKIPLRFAGYGTKDGKPLETAHDQPAAKKAMVLCGVISVLAVAALGFLLLWVLRNY